MADKFVRFRHKRTDENTRALHRETSLSARDFICPVFCVDGFQRREAIESMPGVFRFSLDKLIEFIAPLRENGLSAVLLFGVPESKSIEQSWAEDGLVQQFVPVIRKLFPGLEIITDVCLCSYTPDGHCHIGDNDETCRILGKIASSHARAGAHVVAPSAMMDGQVYYIRRALDSAGFTDARIMSYAAKFASSFYGPFRDAAECAPQSGDRRSYQMDPANGEEALEEIEADIEQGADSIIIKPALSYLDVIARAKKFNRPIVAYNVSGEYRMLNDAVNAGYARPDIINETLVSIKRAGAERIISYFAPALLKQMNVRPHSHEKNNDVQMSLSIK